MDLYTELFITFMILNKIVSQIGITLSFNDLTSFKGKFHFTQLMPYV
jgi:hypothetical protein